MRFHLPRPLRGWREFAGEVGIIVLGVLIALGAQQVVQELNDRRESAKSMDAIRTELAHAAGTFDERSVTQPCIDRRLDELDQIFAAAAHPPAARRGQDLTAALTPYTDSRLDLGAIGPDIKRH